MIKAASAIVLGLAIAVAVWWLPPRAFDAMIFVVAALGAVEFARMFLTDRVERVALVIAIILTSAVMLIKPWNGNFIMAFLSMVFFALAAVVMKRSDELSGSTSRLASMIMGVVYLGVAFPVWGLLRQMSEGNSVVMFVLAPACLTDTFAYIAGKLFGKRKFAPKVSPNKTWEGFAGALFGAILGAWLAWKFFRLDIAFVHVFGMAVVIWIVSPLGDLIESMMKRSSGVKDSGTIIPGHGGVLDRLDALIFTAAAAYFYFEYVIGY